MRKVTLLGTAAALLLGLAVSVSASGASQAAEPSAARSKTLNFDVVFSPFTPVAANNIRDANSEFALGDEIVFYDQLFSQGRRLGDELGSCVLVSLTPVLANCSAVIRLPDGNITYQFPNAPGPEPKDLAITGGTRTYRNAGGDGTLVEFGNGKGRLTIRVLGFPPRGSGA
jgi:hypothetical protein